LEGVVEYRLLKNNKRALSLFDDLAKRHLIFIQKMDEYENGTEYTRYEFNTDSITHDLTKYKQHIKPVIKNNSICRREAVFCK
jgi:hypothetical protein